MGCSSLPPHRCPDGAQGQRELNTCALELGSALATAVGAEPRGGQSRPARRVPSAPSPRSAPRLAGPGTPGRLTRRPGRSAGGAEALAEPLLTSARGEATEGARAGARRSAGAGAQLPERQSRSSPSLPQRADLRPPGPALPVTRPFRRRREGAGRAHGHSGGGGGAATPAGSRASEDYAGRVSPGHAGEASAVVPRG